MRENVRSARRANFFIVDNAVIDHYLEKIGGTAVMIYLILGRYTGTDNKTFVGIERMGKLSGYTKPTVKRALAVLVEHGLIRIIITKEPTPKTTYWVRPSPPPIKRETEMPLFDAVGPEEEIGEQIPPSNNQGLELKSSRNNVLQDCIEPNCIEQDCFNHTNPAPQNGAADSKNPFSEIIAIIDREYSAANNGGKCPWKNKRSFKALGDLLESYPAWSLDAWERCVINRYHSLGYMAAKLEPWEFIPKLYRFADGPLDQFGKQSGGILAGRAKQSSADRLREELEIAHSGQF